MRRTENKEEALSLAYCRDCVSKNLEYARSLFEEKRKEVKKKKMKYPIVVIV